MKKVKYLNVYESLGVFFSRFLRLSLFQHVFPLSEEFMYTVRYYFVGNFTSSFT